MSNDRTFPTVLPLIGLDGIVLASGAHRQRAEAVCAMEAVAWLAGEPHSDHPECACPVIGAFMRQWNDSIRDDETRTRLLKPLLSSLIGTRSTRAVELRRSYLAIDWLARECAPAWLSLRDDLKAHAVALRGLAPLINPASCRAAQAALDAAWAAAWDAARAAAVAAAGDAAGGAAVAAAGGAAVAAAGGAAWDAAWDAARAAAVAAAGGAAWAAAGAALQPTVIALQASASDLVRRMVAITEPSTGGEAVPVQQEP